MFPVFLMESNKIVGDENVVSIGQRVLVSGRICTVRWKGEVAKADYVKRKPLLTYVGFIVGEEFPDESSEVPDTTEDFLKLIGVEWDNWRCGEHNGTVNGVFYFRAEKTQLYENALKKISEVYGEHPEPWIRCNISVSPSDIMFENFGHLTCSFVFAKEISFGVSLAYAVYERYISDEIDGLDLASLECSPHGRGIIGHEFVGRSRARDFFCDTCNLLTLGLQNANIDRLGDCSAYKFPRVREVYLSQNLLWNWDVIRELIRLIPRMETLDLTANLMSGGGEKPLECSTLTTIVLTRSSMSFDDIARVLGNLKNLKSLVLCNNAYTDIPSTFKLDGLESLDLSENLLWNWYSILRLIKSLASLKKLILTDNKLSNLCVDPASGMEMSLYRAALEIAGGGDQRLEAFSGIEELYIDENYIYDWVTISNMAVVFPGLRVLRTKMCMLGKELTPGVASVHRQVYISIFPKLEVLNGIEVSKYDRIDAERYYLSLEYNDSFPFKDVNSHEGLEQSHSSRLEVIHGKRDPPPPASTFIHPINRAVRLVLIPDADSDSYLKPSVTRRLPMDTTVRELKCICSEIYGLDASDIVLVYNDGKQMPVSERMDKDYAELYYYGIEDGYNIKIQSKKVAALEDAMIAALGTRHRL